MIDPGAITYGGREFSPEELGLIRQAACDYAGLGITEIARTICEWLDWRRPNGRLKNHECRLLLERLQDQGLLTLPAWKMAARDHWIGWNGAQRARNLRYIVNNSRFLILPWVQVQGLASTILARSARQLLQDWRKHYGYAPLLLETLVDGLRFKGTC